MRDALGKELRVGQRVAVPCNSRFKIGVLYNYRENRGKYYQQAVAYNARKEAGALTEEDRQYHWLERYYTPKFIEENSHNYYIRFEDGRKRSISNREGIIGVADDAEITV